MSEETTRELPDNRSFEERVFAHFDAMEAHFVAMEARFEARFSSIDSRLDGLEIRIRALESRALDTKPIWERTLAEILEVKNGVEDLNRKIDLLNRDVLQVRADQQRVEKRMDALETRPQ